MFSERLVQSPKAFPPLLKLLKFFTKNSEKHENSVFRSQRMDLKKTHRKRLYTSRVFPLSSPPLHSTPRNVSAVFIRISTFHRNSSRHKNSWKRIFSDITSHNICIANFMHKRRRRKLMTTKPVGTVGS